MEEKDFETLRKTYQEFIYESYELQEDDTYIYLKFCFQIPKLCEFEPVIMIKKKHLNFYHMQSESVQNLCFHIGLIELISYWKICCPKKIIIKAGCLNEEQIAWFQKLYYLGLGEFRYMNHIQISEENFLDIVIEHAPAKKANNTLQEAQRKGVLIPIGGGKDSNVTLELLKQTREDNLCITVGAKEISIECAKIAGYDDEKIIEVIRKIDPRLLELNKQGFLNGHTPFSALLAFLTYFIAVITNKKYIALSNESSAEQTNVKDENINHQYSKTLEFENDFRAYADQYLGEDVTYFSLLRPINELQIAMLFAKLKQYHKTFKSCNVGSKGTEWKWCR